MFEVCKCHDTVLIPYQQDGPLGLFDAPTYDAIHSLNPLSAGWSVRTFANARLPNGDDVLIPYQQDGPLGRI